MFEIDGDVTYNLTDDTTVPGFTEHGGLRVSRDPGGVPTRVSIAPADTSQLSVGNLLRLLGVPADDVPKLVADWGFTSLAVTVSPVAGAFAFDGAGKFLGEDASVHVGVGRSGVSGVDFAFRFNGATTSIARPFGF